MSGSVVGTTSMDSIFVIVDECSTCRVPSRRYLVGAVRGDRCRCHRRRHRWSSPPARASGRARGPRNPLRGAGGARPAPARSRPRGGARHPGRQRSCRCRVARGRRRAAGHEVASDAGGHRAAGGGGAARDTDPVPAERAGQRAHGAPALPERPRCHGAAPRRPPGAGIGRREQQRHHRHPRRRPRARTASTRSMPGWPPTCRARRSRRGPSRTSSPGSGPSSSATSRTPSRPRAPTCAATPPVRWRRRPAPRARRASPPRAGAGPTTRSSTLAAGG